MARIPKGSVYRLDPHTLRGNAYSLPVVVRGRGGKKMPIRRLSTGIGIGSREIVLYLRTTISSKRRMISENETNGTLKLLPTSSPPSNFSILISIRDLFHLYFDLFFFVLHDTISANFNYIN